MKNITSKKTVIPCFMCRQPIVEGNRFTVSWDEEGQEEIRQFCGSRCLRDWAEAYSDSIKLDQLEIIE